ncbi:MAG: hypothetical protein ACKOSS_11300, partial [Planctomycetia bacterium]
PATRAGSFVMSSPVAPIPVQPPSEPTPIDILFVLDDSGVNPALGGLGAQLGMVYGDMALEPGRKKQAVARQVMQDIVANIKADLQAAYPGVSFDLAFGVARYEDFGGAFRPQDALARPFIVNQPIYRLDREGALSLLGSAFLREAPGHGNQPGEPVDPQALVEALCQAATGMGFDGNGDGDTSDSGLFGAETTQTAPGASGDVPAASFAADGNDEDGAPRFVTPGGAAASGNLGGVGWRPRALRYILTTTDIPAVTPFPAGQAIPPSVTSTSGGAYPRSARAIPTQAFASNTTLAAQAAQRFGVLPEPVAPAGACTLQQAIQALNTGPSASNPLNIEVLGLGTLRTAPLPFKPNLPGATYPSVPAITDPSTPDASPFTMLSALAYLTGAQRTWPGSAEPLALVYNLATVFPKTALAPKADIREDLVFRVGQGMPALPAPTRPALAPEVVTYEGTATLPGGSPLVIAALDGLDEDGTGTTITVAGSLVTVRVPRYYSDEAKPAALRVAWLVQFTELLDDNVSKSDVAEVKVLLAGATRVQGTVSLVMPPTPEVDQPGTADNVTATLGTVTTGCLTVRDPNNNIEGTGGTCP